MKVLMDQKPRKWNGRMKSQTSVHIGVHLPRGRKAGATNQGELGCCDLHHSVLEGAPWSTTISEVSLELLEPRNLRQLSKGKENDLSY